MEIPLLCTLLLISPISATLAPSDINAAEYEEGSKPISSQPQQMQPSHLQMEPSRIPDFPAPEDTSKPSDYFEGDLVFDESMGNITSWDATDDQFEPDQEAIPKKENAQNTESPLGRPVAAGPPSKPKSKTPRKPKPKNSTKKKKGTKKSKKEDSKKIFVLKKGEDNGGGSGSGAKVVVVGGVEQKQGSKKENTPQVHNNNNNNNTSTKGKPPKTSTKDKTSPLEYLF